MCQQLSDALTKLADKLLPIKNIFQHSKPWISKEISQVMKHITSHHIEVMEAGLYIQEIL